MMLPSVRRHSDCKGRVPGQSAAPCFLGVAGQKSRLSNRSKITARPALY